MKRLLCLSLLALFLVSASGCALLRRDGPSRPKAVTAIAADTDAKFKALWIDQREKELVGEGLTAAAASARAVEEFAAKYRFTRPAR